MIAPAHIHHPLHWYWNWVYFGGMLPSGLVLYTRNLYRITRRFPDQKHFWGCFLIAMASMLGWYITLPLDLYLNQGGKDGYMLRPLTREWRFIAHKSKYPNLARDQTLETWDE